MKGAYERDPEVNPNRDGLVAFALRMSKHAEQELEAEGFHPPMYVLWPQDKGLKPVTRLLDDSGPEAIAGWGAAIARAAAEARATTAVLIMEGWAAKPPGRRDEAQEVLIVAAANADGQEVIIERPTAPDDHGRRHARGERVVRPETQELSAFGPLRALWRRSVSRPSRTSHSATLSEAGCLPPARG